MNMTIKKTLTLTKAEKEVLANFFWNLYDDDADNIYDTLKALAEDTFKYSPYAIEITD